MSTPTTSSITSVAAPKKSVRFKDTLHTINLPVNLDFNKKPYCTAQPLFLQAGESLSPTLKLLKDIESVYGVRYVSFWANKPNVLYISIENEDDWNETSVIIFDIIKKHTENWTIS